MGAGHEPDWIFTVPEILVVCIIHCLAASIRTLKASLIIYSSKLKVLFLPECLFVLDYSDPGGHIYINQQPRDGSDHQILNHIIDHLMELLCGDKGTHRARVSSGL